MNPISGLRTAFVTLVVGLTIGFGAGYYTERQFAKADQLDAAVTAQHDTAKGIEQSVKTDVIVEAKVETSNIRIDTIRKTAAKRIQTQEKANEADLKANRTCSPSLLDVGTVWLLNDARGYAAPDATPQTDAEGKTTSEIGIAELADSDLEVVKLYQELAIDHDALVDYVESLLKKQAE